MPIYLVGIDAKSYTIQERERFFLNEEELFAQNERFLRLGKAEEIVALSTCNRLEYYMYTHTNIEHLIPKLFPFTTKDLNILHGHSVAHHLFRVAAGLESQVLGENEILGQIKQAYYRAHSYGHTNKHLNILFQKALSVGKKVRTDTSLSKHAISTAGIILNIIKKHFKNFQQSKVLLVGTGKIARKIIPILIKKGIHNITISSRNTEKGPLIAKETHTQFSPLSNLRMETQSSCIIISATTSQKYIFTHTQTPFFTNTQKLLFDLAVPRDIDPQIGTLENVSLYNIDDIKSTLHENKQKRHKEIEHAEKIIHETYSYYSLAQNKKTNLKTLNKTSTRIN